MSKTIKIEYKYTFEEVVTSGLEVTKAASKLTGILPWVGGAIMLLIVSLSLVFGIAMIEFLDRFLFPMILATTFLAMPLALRVTIKRAAKKRPDLNNIIKWTVDDKKLQNSTSDEGGHFLWSKIIKIHERKTGFLLFKQKKLAFWIPKTGFMNQADIESFKEMALQNEVPYKT